MSPVGLGLALVPVGCGAAGYIAGRIHAAWRPARQVIEQTEREYGDGPVSVALTERGRQAIADMDEAVAITKAPPRAAPSAPQVRPVADPRVTYTVRAWSDGHIAMWDGNGTLIANLADGGWDAALDRLIKGSDTQ